MFPPTKLTFEVPTVPYPHPFSIFPTRIHFTHCSTSKKNHSRSTSFFFHSSSLARHHLSILRFTIVVRHRVDHSRAFPQTNLEVLLYFPSGALFYYTRCTHCTCSSPSSSVIHEHLHLQYYLQYSSCPILSQSDTGGSAFDFLHFPATLCSSANSIISRLTSSPRSGFCSHVPSFGSMLLAI